MASMGKLGGGIAGVGVSFRQFEEAQSIASAYIAPPVKLLIDGFIADRCARYNEDMKNFFYNRSVDYVKIADELTDCFKMYLRAKMYAELKEEATNDE